MRRPHLMINPRPKGTRLVLRARGQTLLRATLPPPWPHPSCLRVAPMLAQALALWLDQRLCIVLNADEPDGLSGLGLCDDCGFGDRTPYYEVRVHPVRRRSPGHRREEAGAPADPRQLDLLGVQ